MLKLYGGAPSRASIVHWYLEELGIPYEFVVLRGTSWSETVELTAKPMIKKWVVKVRGELTWSFPKGDGEWL